MKKNKLKQVFRDLDNMTKEEYRETIIDLLTEVEIEDDEIETTHEAQSVKVLEGKQLLKD